MFLDELLNKYRALTNNHQLKMEKIKLVINDYYKINLDSSNLNLKNNCLFIINQQSLRSNIFINKKPILEKINQELLNLKLEILKDIK